MATAHFFPLLSFPLFLLLATSNSLASPSASAQDYSSIVDYGFNHQSNPFFEGDYSPPSPPTPAPPPHPPAVSCHDLNGVGSLNTTCELKYSLNFTDDVYIEGMGDLIIRQGVTLICPKFSCTIEINITGDFRLDSTSQIVAGTVYIVAGNASLFEDSVINVTGRAAEPQEPSPGTPDDAQGSGGGHGGRGASCVMDNKKLPEDIWGGDAYAWDTLEAPFSYGSKGGTTSRGEDYGGMGGGRIWLEVKKTVEVRGLLLADGGAGGIKGGGGSGGSIFIKAKKM